MSLQEDFGSGTLKWDGLYVPILSSLSVELVGIIFIRYMSRYNYQVKNDEITLDIFNKSGNILSFVLVAFGRLSHFWGRTMRVSRVLCVAAGVLVAVVVVLVGVWFLVRTSGDDDATANPIVTISQGIVRGLTTTTASNRPIYSFLGIPYAEAPIGSLRFAAPVAKGNWSETLDATQDSEACPQDEDGVVTGNEDCLYINVYTPMLPNSENSTLLPVLVYLHGGAYKMGSNNSTYLGPGYLLEKDIILIVPNYRVGVLGFLSTGDETSPGNYALKDQLLALQWVRDNVKYFGGDPNKVTLMGMSSGASSAHLLTFAEQSQGLFHTLITQSGNAYATWSQQPRVSFSKLAYQLGDIYDCSNETSTILVDCLRNLSMPEIVDGGEQLYSWQNISPTVLFGPTVEPDFKGALLPDTIANLLAGGKNLDVPWIVSVAANEGIVNGGYFYTHDDVLQDFFDNFDDVLQYRMPWNNFDFNISAMTSAVKEYYFNNDFTTNRTALLFNSTAIETYGAWKYPAKESLVDYVANKTSPVYLYSFEYRGTRSNSIPLIEATEDYGAVHGDDSLYLFPTTDNNIVTENDVAMRDTMVEMITSFVIDGVPTVSRLDGTWAPYSSEDNYLRVGNHASSDLTIQSSFINEEMSFWDEVYAMAPLNSA